MQLRRAYYRSVIYWIIVDWSILIFNHGQDFICNIFPHPPFYSAHLSHELERSVSRSKIYRCWQAAEVPRGLFILTPRQQLTTSFRCFLFWSRRHQLLHTSALQSDKAASIDPQSLTAYTFIRRRWRPRHSPRPIKESALPTGAAGSKRLLAGQIRSRLEPRSADAGSRPVCVIARQLCRSQMIHDKRY